MKVEKKETFVDRVGFCRGLSVVEDFLKGFVDSQRGIDGLGHKTSI